MIDSHEARIAAYVELGKVARVRQCSECACSCRLDTEARTWDDMRKTINAEPMDVDSDAQMTPDQQSSNSIDDRQPVVCDFQVASEVEKLQASAVEAIGSTATHVRGVMLLLCD